MTPGKAIERDKAMLEPMLKTVNDFYGIQGL
jgi:hypothetical protein